jgi:thioredoxin 1
MESWFRLEALEVISALLEPVDKNRQEWESSMERKKVYYFTAEWCTPCKKLAPVLQSVYKDYEYAVELVKLDADKERSMLDMFGIKSVPTMVYYKSDGSYVIKPVIVSKQFVEDVFFEAKNS